MKQFLQKKENREFYQNVFKKDEKEELEKAKNTIEQKYNVNLQ